MELRFSAGESSPTGLSRDSSYGIQLKSTFNASSRLAMLTNGGCTVYSQDCHYWMYIYTITDLRRYSCM